MSASDAMSTVGFRVSVTMRPVMRPRGYGILPRLKAKKAGVAARPALIGAVGLSGLPAASDNPSAPASIRPTPTAVSGPTATPATYLPYVWPATLVHFTSAFVPERVSD